MNRYKFAFLLLGLFLSLTPAITQEYIANVQYFGVDQGLSHRETFCTFQDSRGFIWVGTKYGLNLFDGHRFKIFSKEKNGLVANDVRSIIEDAEGWLWLLPINDYSRFVNKNEVSFLNIYTYEIQTWEQRFGNTPTFVDNISIPKHDSDRTIYFGTQNGQIIKYSDKVGFTEMLIAEGEEIYVEYLSPNKTITAKLNPKTTAEVLIELDSTGNEIWRSKVSFLSQICETEGGVKWYWTIEDESRGENAHLYFLEGSGELRQVPKFKRQREEKWVPRNKPNIYFRDWDNTFWYADIKQFFLFYPAEGVLIDMNTSHAEIARSDIHDIYFDNRKNAWIATSSGIFKVQLNPSPFRKFLTLPKSEYTLNTALSIRGMAELAGNLFVNTTGRDQFNIDLETGEPYPLEDLKIARNSTPPEHLIFTPLIALNDKQLFFGDSENVIYDIVNQTHKIVYDKKEVAHIATWSLFKDKKNTVWSGHDAAGIKFWNTGMDSVQNFNKYNEYNAIKESTVYSFLQWDDENLLVGSTSGIYVLNYEKGITHRFWSAGTDGQYISDEHIFHLHRDQDDEHIIWAATGGGGVIKIDFNNKLEIIEQKQITVSDGLSSNVIYAVYEDDRGHLWLPSDYGIIRLNKSTYASKAFLEKDGISHHEFNRVSHYKGKDGTLFFGGLNGITAFHPNDLIDEESTFDAPLEILSYHQYDGKIDNIADKTSALIANPEITLQSGDRFFRIDFSLLEYQDAKQVRYAYRIEGQENDWNFIEGNTLRVSGLPAGEYVLQIKGQGASGQFSIKERRIPVHVLKPFYREIWFLSSVAFLLIGGVFFWYKRRTYDLKKRQAELEEAVQTRTETIIEQQQELAKLSQLKSRFFTNVSHELRTPLSLMLGPLQSVLKRGERPARERKLLEMVSNNSKHLLKLVNEILDLSKLETGRLEMKEEVVQFHGFLQPTVAQFSSFGDSESVKVYFDYQTDPELNVVIDKGKFEKIIHNFLSNAIKFSPLGGVVNFKVEEKEEDLLLISVTDHGQGIHPDDLPHVFDRFYQSKQADTPTQSGTGIGLSLAAELAKLLGGKIWVESEYGQGSVFYFQFPVKKVDQPATKRLAVVAEAGNRANGAIVLQRPLLEHKIEQVIALAPVPEVGPNLPTILIVEDNAELRAYMQLLLEDKYKVFTAENGKVAWEWLMRVEEQKMATPEEREARPIIDCQPSLIISDLMMPVMDGFTFLEKVKKHEYLQHLPFIMLTARADARVRLRALRIGVDDYLTKPFVEEELYVRIQNLLKNAVERSKWQEEETGTTNGTVLYDSPTLPKEDQDWLEALEATALEKIGNFNFSIEQLSHEMAVSRWQLNRQIKKLTGLTAQNYLQEVRLNLALNLLERKEISTVKALTYQLGVRDVRHFSRTFKSRFGKLPSEYL